MIEKQFGYHYGPAMTADERLACWSNLRAEIDRLGGVPGLWLSVSWGSKTFIISPVSPGV